MGNIVQTIRALDIFRAIAPYLPDDHCRCQSLANQARQLYDQGCGPLRVLDLGCGAGKSRQMFGTLAPAVQWHGVDIEGSPELRSQPRAHSLIQTFNGVNLPYVDRSFDLIYCNQVLEHARHPDCLLAEAFRVLQPGGIFLGAVSYLEPHHSASIFHFTPYAIVRVCTEAGFVLEEIRPGADAALLLLRQLCCRSRKLRFFWNRNYLHGLIDVVAALARLPHRERNFLKVQFAGHLLFRARRPDKAPW